MKRINSYFLALSILSLSILSSCGGGGGGGGDDTPQLTPEEQQLVDLAGTSSGVTWATTSVTFDGASSDFFEDLTLTIRGTATSKSYTSSNGSPLFGANGTWDFNGSNINQIIFDGDDGNIYSINLNASATPATLTMTVNYTASGGVAAGINGADGTYVFNMEKQ